MAADFYDIGAALLRQEPPRFAALQSVIEQVNAKLARPGDPLFAPAPEETLGKKRRIGFRRGVQGAADQAAVVKPADLGLTHADALALFTVPHAQSGAAEPVVALSPSLRPHKQEDSIGGRLSGAQIMRLVTQARPVVGDHALPAASILSRDVLKTPEAKQNPERVSSLGSGNLRLRSPFVVPSVRNGPGEGAQISVRDPARNGPNAGAMIDDVWRRIKTPAREAAGDTAYGADGGGARFISAIVTATLAAQQAAPFSGRAPEFAQEMPGATPDAPVYTRMVPDHPAVPVQVTNADALTNSTVNTLAAHQSALPTGPTGLNNNLVPPAPGVPAPGSYQP